MQSRHQIYETERFLAGKGKVIQFLMGACVVMGFQEGKEDDPCLIT